jgi:hypothetical protein
LSVLAALLFTLAQETARPEIPADGSWLLKHRAGNSKRTEKFR